MGQRERGDGKGDEKRRQAQRQATEECRHRGRLQRNAGTEAGYRDMEGWSRLLPMRGARECPRF